jgi:hypothetical protein
MMPEPTTVATSNAVPSASAVNRRGKSTSGINWLSPGRSLLTADIAQPSPERQTIDALQRQACEDGNSIFEIAQRCNERGFLLYFRALGFGRVFNAPMRRHRLAGPYRAGLASGVVANRENEIHHGCIGACEFLPTLRTQIIDRVIENLENLDRKRIDCPLRLAAGGEGAEVAAAVFAQDRFRKNRTGAVSGAQEENVVDALRHGPSSSASAGNT